MARYQQKQMAAKMTGEESILFPKLEIFKKLHDSLRIRDEKKTKNLIDFKDSVLFAWKSDDCKLLVQHLKNKESLTFYQELFPTDPPLFEVCFVVTNTTTSKVVLWGPDGVCVMNLPRRWGPNAAFQGGKGTIISSSCNIDGQYFSSKTGDICQVKFHPGSAKDNHLLVLTSMNTFRLYVLHEYVDIHTDMVNLLSVWSLGPQPHNTVGLQYLVGLGDTAVDFDFCPPLLKTKNEEKNYKSNFCLKEENVAWPVIILCGNGDVYSMDTKFCDTKTKPKLFGPLSMFPSADDNYGVDACSVLVLQTTPNIIVITTCCGTLHHFIMLTSHDEEKSDWNIERKQALYLLESVELELGWKLQDNGDNVDDGGSNTSSIYLHHDPATISRYYCLHNTGVHSVSLPFVNDLQNFFDTATNALNQTHQTPIVEYLICTKTHSSPLLPVSGLTVLTTQRTLLVLLSSGDVVDLKLKTVELTHDAIKFTLESEDNCDDVSPIKKLLREPFDSHVKKMLKKSFNQPLLKISKNVKLTPQETLDLVVKTVSLLRKEYFVKYDEVYNEIEKRIDTLCAFKLLQLNDLQDIDKKKDLCRSNAESLAEKYEEINYNQSLLTKRVERLLVKVLERDPVESVAEKKMRNQLLLVKEKVESYKKTISDVKEKSNYQKFKISKEEVDKLQNVHLNENQIETIRLTLKQTLQEISTQIENVNVVKQQMELFDN